METYYAVVPRGLGSFLTGLPSVMNEKLFIRKSIIEGLAAVQEELTGDGNYKLKDHKLLFSGHHLSHAASAFYPSPFEEAAILTIDGVGEWATASLGFGRGREIKILKELKFPHSLGLLYSAFTYYAGFKVNSGEHKLMGLAAYGDENSRRTKEYIELIYKHLIDVKEDGSLWLNMDYFDYTAGLTMTNDRKWKELFGIDRREPESPLSEEYADLAFAAQKVAEDVVQKMAATAKRLSGSKKLVLAGGAALNCVANGKLLESGLFDEIWVQPAADDAGGALGAAYAVWHMMLGEKRVADGRTDKMKGSYLGPDYCDKEVERALRRYRPNYTKFENQNNLCEFVAKLISEGKVVGWFQGRMEWGPRALGNRSILADARSIEVRDRMNFRVKRRENFRAFAPAVIYEDAGEYFVIDKPSPYMLFTVDLAEGQRLRTSESLKGNLIQEKLNDVESSIPAVINVDYSARCQTVQKDSNSVFYELIEKFKEITGCSVILNTSFNVRGEPIVCDPEDAYRCFMGTDIDYLVINGFLFEKTQQPECST